MDDTKVYTACYHCNDWFEVTDEVLGIKPKSKEPEDIIRNASTSFLWWCEDKVCLNCGNIYSPFKLSIKTYPFVYEAFRTVKM